MDAVLNWIWQGSVVAIAAAGMLRLLEPARAHLRYRALWIVLATILILPLVPLAWAATVVSGLGPVSLTIDPVIPLPPGRWLSTGAVLVICAAWTMALAGRVLPAALALRRARRDCRPFAADRQARLRFWTEIRSSGRQTRLMVSEAVSSAAVLAGRTPIIALAPSAIDRLADDELDRVVIHEWAHVQRRDDLAHVLQVIVRLFAGWHPAVWWCDRRLHLEREIACDEIAVRVTGSTKAYAACLATLASLPSARLRPLHAVGALSGSNLHHRIVRILALDRRPSNRVRMVMATAAPILIGAFAFVVGGYRAIGAVPATAERAARTLVGSFTATANSGPGPLTMPLASPRTPGAGAVRVPRATRSDAHQSTPPVANPYTMLAAGTTAAPGADTSAAPSAPLPSRPLASGRFEPPHVAAAADAAVAPAANAAQRSARQAVAPWSAAAGAGVSVGGGAQDAALATAGFFNRLGRKIADSF